MKNLHIEHRNGDAPLVERGTRMGSFEVGSMISNGGFGQIFEASEYSNNNTNPTPTPLAIKVESMNAKVKLLYTEASCLRSLNEAYNPNRTHQHEPFLNFYGYGERDNLRFLVMEKCGPNLRDLKAMTPLNRFSSPTSFWIMYKMIVSLEKMHNIGWLHRDVKPANFCVGLNSARSLFVLDFGMSRVFVSSDGSLKPRKVSSPFHGTLRYVSLNIHRRKDASRWDDLWSVFYISIENMVGFLPWRRLGAVSAVESTKQSANFGMLNYGREERQPLSLEVFHQCLMVSLDDDSCFYTPPPYHKLLNVIRNDLWTRNTDIDRVALDWTQPQYAPTYSYTGQVYNMTAASKTKQACPTPNTRIMEAAGGDHHQDRSVRFY